MLAFLGCVYVLAEEIECTACQQSLVDNHVSCESCNQHFHDTCIDTNSNTCHACKGSYHQQSLDLIEQHLPTMQENTSLKNILLDTHPSSIDGDQIIRDEHNTNVKETTSSNRKKLIPSPNSEENISEHTIKLKDLRQLELRLKKKEEQLKIRESLLNDDLKEKEKF